MGPPEVVGVVELVVDLELSGADATEPLSGAGCIAEGVGAVAADVGFIENETFFCVEITVPVPACAEPANINKAAKYVIVFIICIFLSFGWINYIRFYSDVQIVKNPLY
ncbi:MAG: hypothetical protein LBB23_03150 [Rickettsiales bacterium]|jgi:hypothetical protein|nr:hypothetical protein [Rickettsiales bacterium]